MRQSFLYESGVSGRGRSYFGYAGPLLSGETGAVVLLEAEDLGATKNASGGK